MAKTPKHSSGQRQSGTQPVELATVKWFIPGSLLENVKPGGALARYVIYHPGDESRNRQPKKNKQIEPTTQFFGLNEIQDQVDDTDLVAIIDYLLQNADRSVREIHEDVTRTLAAISE